MLSGLGLGLTPSPIGCHGSDTQSSEPRAEGNGCLTCEDVARLVGPRLSPGWHRGTQSPACPGGQ